MSASQLQFTATRPATIVGRGAASANAGEEMAVLTLDDRGMVRDCDRGAELLFKYRRSELVWRHVSVLLPKLADMELMPDGQPNPRLRFVCRVGRHLQAVTRDGERFDSELFFSVLDGAAGHGRLVLVVRPAEHGLDT